MKLNIVSVCRIGHTNGGWWALNSQVLGVMIELGFRLFLVIFFFYFFFFICLVCDEERVGGDGAGI